MLLRNAYFQAASSLYTSWQILKQKGHSKYLPSGTPEGRDGQSTFSPLVLRADGVRVMFEMVDFRSDMSKVSGWILVTEEGWDECAWGSGCGAKFRVCALP